MNVATAYYTRAELNRLIPPLPKPRHAPAVAFTTGAAISDDDCELIARLGQRSPVFGRLYAGDTSDYAAQNGIVDDNVPEWALVQDLLRATGGDQVRTYQLMRQSALERDKWDERRLDGDYLQYTIARAAESPSAPASAVDQDEHTAGPCPNCATYRRQIELINQLVRADLPALYRLVLLYLVAVVGYYQSRGTQSFETRATQIARRLHVSAQSVRPVLHSLARYDNGELMREDGLVDLRVTRQGLRGDDACACPCHDGRDDGPGFCAACRNQDAMISAFEVAPLTDGGYAGFLEAVVNYVPNLPDAPTRPTRKKVAAVEPPPEVVTIPDCQGAGAEHYRQSANVVCASCGDELLATTSYTPLNANPQRSAPTQPPAWIPISDKRQRSALQTGSDVRCRACGEPLRQEHEVHLQLHNDCTLPFVERNVS